MKFRKPLAVGSSIAAIIGVIWAASGNELGFFLLIGGILGFVCHLPHNERSQLAFLFGSA